MADTSLVCLPSYLEKLSKWVQAYKYIVRQAGTNSIILLHIIMHS